MHHQVAATIAFALSGLISDVEDIFKDYPVGISRTKSLKQDRSMITVGFAVKDQGSPHDIELVVTITDELLELSYGQTGTKIDLRRHLPSTMDFIEDAFDASGQWVRDEIDKKLEA
ncbi:MAG: hypothetical protein G8237_09615 [Magnetococcales bacterium]|nr:hypothetical protein [Magnetococcales bacterium]NGZ06602.1 hypothetical protein [Magnetococcales bacterium]